MRFGIQAIQIATLIPPDLPPENVMAHLAGFEHAGMVRPLVEAGFNPIEIGGDLALFLPQTLQPAAIEGLVHLKRDFAIDYTLHLPLWSVEPSTPLTPVRKGSVQALAEAIEATRPLEPEVYVLHATGALAAEFTQMHLPDVAKAIILRQFQSGAIESIRTLLRQTGLPSRKIAIETIEFPFDLTIEIAETLDLSVCLDTGHVLAGFSGSVDLFNALERMLPRLAEIHLHDAPQSQGAPGYGTDHQPLGSGDLDTARLLDRLAEADYQGPIIFELRLDQALASMEHIRKIRPQYLTP